MKKTLAIVAAVIMAGSAFAQEGTFYLGATGISAPDITFPGNNSVTPSLFTGISYEKIGDNSVTAFGINPELGYFISNNFAVGLGLGFTYYSLPAENNMMAWGVNPYVRYYAIQIDKFSLYLQGGLSYVSSKMKDVDAVNTFYVGVKPGVAYSVSDRFAINATFGNLGYFNYGESHSAFELQLSPATLSFGLTFSF